MAGAVTAVGAAPAAPAGMDRFPSWARRSSRSSGQHALAQLRGDLVRLRDLLEVLLPHRAVRERVLVDHLRRRAALVRAVLHAIPRLPVAVVQRAEPALRLDVLPVRPVQVPLVVLVALRRHRVQVASEGLRRPLQ